VLAKLRTRFTYANTMATIAVFVALGGSSYAAITVTGKNVKNSSLTGKDIKNSSLTTSDVKNASLLSADFKAGQLPAGPQGPKGTTGDTGGPGVSALQRVVVVSALDSISPKTIAVPCPAGKRLLSLTGTLTGGLGQVVFDDFSPNSALTSGTVTAYEDETGVAGNWNVQGFAICANVAP
jgi:hypothetical protein